MPYPDGAVLDLPGGPHARPMSRAAMAAEDRAAAGRLLFTAAEALAIDCDRLWDEQGRGTADAIDGLTAELKVLHAKLRLVLGPA